MAKSNFPWWYRAVQWIPYILAGVAAYLVTGGLCGFVSIPAQLGMLQWAPVFYGSLEGLNAIVALLAITGMISCTIGLVTNFITRGLLKGTAEKIANDESTASQNLREENLALKHQKEQDDKELCEARSNANNALAAANRYRDQVNELKEKVDIQATRTEDAPSVLSHAVPPPHAMPPVYSYPFPYPPMPLQTPYYASHCAMSMPCSGHQKHHHCVSGRQFQPRCGCAH